MNKEELQAKVKELEGQVKKSQVKLDTILSDKTTFLVYNDSEGKERALMSGVEFKRDGRLSQSGKSFTHLFGSKKIKIRDSAGDVKEVKAMFNVRANTETEEEEVI